jgi:hypothetical protein
MDGVQNAAPGLMMGGGVLFTMSQVMRRRFQPLTSAPEWKLTPEAKGLLLKLVQQRLGWHGFGSPIHGKRGRIVMRRVAWQSGDPSFGWFGRSNASVAPEVMRLLEVAATAYNRIQGTLQSPSGSSLTKIAPSAAKAADEAMATIFDNSATMDRYPESVAATQVQITKEIAALTELGDRLEQLVTRQETITDKMASATTMDAVLDDLRLEQLARNELQVSSEEPGSQQLKA